MENSKSNETEAKLFNSLHNRIWY